MSDRASVSLSAPYWEGVEQDLLRYQACGECGRNVFPARLICPSCDGWTLQWRDGGGTGAVYTWSTVYRAPEGAWQPLTPYTIGLIHLDEDYYMLSGIRDVEPEDVHVGMRVTVTFGHHGEGRKLPFFVPA